MNHEKMNGSGESGKPHNAPMDAARRDGPDGPQGHRPVLAGGRPDAGAPPSNTAPANYTKNDLGGATVLRQGVDSLYVSYPGTLARNWEQRLQGLKLAARAQEEADRSHAQVRLGEHLLEVSDRGQGKFAYVLADNCFRIALSGHQAESLPLAYVQISSECLTALGVRDAESSLDYIIRSLGNVSAPANLSRVDVFVDFVADITADAWPARAWITRAHQINSHHVQGRFSGWSIGLGGAVAARLYDKTLELGRSRKDYLKPLWKAAGWQEDQTVWRIEFEFKRAALKDLDVCGIDDLDTALGPLWDYATGSWLRLTKPNDSDDNQSRWPSHPLWDALRNISWGEHEGPRLARVRKDRAPSDEALFINGLGGITSFMAREGITDLGEGFGEFLARAHRFHDLHGRAKGQSFEKYVQTKVENKGRRYNTIENTDPEAVQRRREEAEAYRKARDGE